MKIMTAMNSNYCGRRCDCEIRHNAVAQVHSGRMNTGVAIDLNGVTFAATECAYVVGTVMHCPMREISRAMVPERDSPMGGDE